MNKKQYIIFFSLIIVGLFFGLIQYFSALRTEFASAVATGTPNPGHSWSTMECSSDTLCIDTVNKRLGIGTNTPATELDVVGNVSVSKGIRLNTAGGGVNLLVTVVREGQYG